MISLENNPYIESPDHPNAIFLAQTRDTLLDTEVYSRFIYNCENAFRKSRFYKDYKCFIMNLGITMDQNMPAITGDMATLELHHNLPELRYAAIMICEHILNVKGCVTTFEVIQALEEAHRNHWFDVVILSKTNHEMHHANPTDFISTNQCFGNGYEFINRYIDGMTLDISYAILLQIKLEEQYNGESYNPSQIRARDQILNWQYYNTSNPPSYVVPTWPMYNTLNQIQL